jgi:glycosyltransferase involved in cell wall biosynthesis
MIVKNEEAVLPRALANWRELADELIIVDTGSSDHTIEIAQAHEATVLHYDWQYPGNKGAARMMGIDAAQGEWIVVLDADEIIQEPAKLRAWLRGPTARSFTAANVVFENYIDGNLTLKWYQVRVFQRGMYRYIHREHELPHWCGDGEPKEALLSDVIFEHRSPAGRESGKMQPMIDRLLDDVAEHPGDPGPLYFLHRQYLLNGEYDKAIQVGKSYLNSKDVDYCEAYGNIATAYHLRGDTQEAIRWLHRAAAEQAHRRIWWVRIAEMHMTQGRWQLALAHLRLAAELWPTFEWQWEPDTNGHQLQVLIEKCQSALQSMHHVH